MKSLPNHKISKLSNSLYFGIKKAFIIELEEVFSYRLVVVNSGSVLTDITYPTLRGAKIAFIKLFGNQCYKGGGAVNNKSGIAQWSQFYEIDNEWLAHWTQPEKQEKD